MLGVFDSGYGGLGVLRHIRAALPLHDLVYFGDSGRAPYGGRDTNTLLDFSEQAVERLIEEGCNVLVVACNTVSCVALRHLQKRYASADSDCRILGVTVPGAELVANHAREHVGVIATRRTVASRTYVQEIHKLRSLRVSQQAAPLLAPIVEEGWEASEIARLAIREYLRGLPNIDTLLLGCTHYPHLYDLFAESIPDDVKILDPAPFVAARLVDWLTRHPEFDHSGSAQLRVLCSGDPDHFREEGARFFGAPLPPVTHVAEIDGRLANRTPGSAPVGQVVRSI